MKKDNNTSFKDDPDKMKAEHDFSKMKSGVRGKYHKTYRSGHEVRINKENGSTDIHYFGLEDGAVMLDPDVLNYFPDSNAVNKTLRALITIFPEKYRKETPKQASR